MWLGSGVFARPQQIQRDSTDLMTREIYPTLLVTGVVPQDRISGMASVLVSSLENQNGNRYACLAWRTLPELRRGYAA